MKKYQHYKKNLSKSLVILILVLNSTLAINAEENLQEQEFQTIETQNTVIENENDFGYFVSSLPTEKKTNSDNLFYNLKNEYYESIKVVLEASFSESPKTTNSEFYLNAYESVKDISIPTNAKIKVKVFNLYDQYLGYIDFKNNQKDRNLKISPFLLVPAEFDQKNKKITNTIKEVQKAVDKAVIKDEIKDGVGLIIPKSSSAVTQVQETKNSNKAPEPIIKTSAPEISSAILDAKSNLAQTPMDTKPKKIKIANISDSSINLIIKKSSGEIIGESWTVANDVYVPQFLNLQSEPIIIEPDSTIIITNTKSLKTLIKKASELNIDERGNYVWFIEGFPDKPEASETKNVLH
jgi:hypothetical protein